MTHTTLKQPNSSASKTESTETPTATKKKHPIQNLLAGGIAGLVESSCCHPLDTIKTRMQLRRQFVATNSVTPLNPVRTRPMGRLPVVTATLGPIGTARRIVKREGLLALYKGLTAVYTGIVPKMAIRFLAFESYRDFLHERLDGSQFYNNNAITFAAGLGAGLTEAILVVTPAEVCKIRMQAQYHSLMDPAQMKHRKYTNIFQTAPLIVREEGLSALYKGVVPTMMRQGTNQAVNFTVYQYSKRKWIEWSGEELKSWQHLLLGGISGGFGPLVNNPLDVVKTRMQKQVIVPGLEPKYNGLLQSCLIIAKEEGALSLWKGITPRLLRIMPGQAITFMVYEMVNKTINNMGWFK